MGWKTPHVRLLVVVGVLLVTACSSQHPTLPSDSGGSSGQGGSRVAESPTTEVSADATSTPPAADAVSAPAAPITLSIRQVYETNSTSMGTDVPDMSSVGSSAGSAIGPGAVLPTAAGPNPSTPETAPTAAELAAYAALDCTNAANHSTRSSRDQPNSYLVTCGNPDGSPIWFKYLLHPTLILGTEITTASASLDAPTGSHWDVLLTFNSAATSRWATFTGAHISTLIAIVLDGNVFSAETIQGQIIGPTQIVGAFTKTTATALAAAIQAQATR